MEEPPLPDDSCFQVPFQTSLFRDTAAGDTAGEMAEVSVRGFARQIIQIPAETKAIRSKGSAN